MRLAGCLTAPHANRSRRPPFQPANHVMYRLPEHRSRRSTCQIGRSGNLQYHQVRAVSFRDCLAVN